MIEKCVTCVRPGKDCLRRIIGFPAAELLQWCKGRKKFLDLSNAEIAEKANVPKGTIDRLFSSHEYTEFRFSTIQPIVCILAGCNPKDLDCEDQPSNDAILRETIDRQLEQIRALEEKYNRAKEKIGQVETIYREDIEKFRNETKDRISFFKEHVRLLRKSLITVSIMLAISIGVIITVLIV